MVGSGYIPGSWITKYVTCFLTSFSSECDNEIEQEAYDYADGCPGTYGGKLRLCVDAAGLGVVGPCDCSGLPPFRETQVGVPPDTQTFLQAIQSHCPLIPKRSVSSQIDIWSCIGKLCKHLPVIGCILGLGALVIGFLAGIISIFGLTGLPGAIGTIGGFIIGGIIGGIIGSVLGGILGGILGAIVGAIVGAILGAIIGSLLDWIADFFGSIGDFFTGGGAHSLNLLFSTDDGQTFGNKVTLERSSEPPALAFGPLPSAPQGKALFLAWTDTDDHLNILRVPPPTKTRFWEANDDCGPALATAYAQLFIAWQDGDNHLFLAPSPGLNPAYIGQAFGVPVRLPGSSQDSSTPALAFDAAGRHVYFAWADGDGHLFVSGSSDGFHWEAPYAVGETTVEDGTPALAFGHGLLFLAWTGTDDDNHLNVLALVPAPQGGGGFAPLRPKTVLRERSSDDAGPALAFGHERLFLAWTDDDDRVKVAVSTDDGATFGPPWYGGEHSSDNAGPALGYLESTPPGNPGLLCLAWVGQD
jgi:hypothetical protein